MLKLGAKEQPKAEMVRNTNPVISSDLCLNLTLKAPMSKAKITATMEEKVRICPVTPTELPNVRPISIRRRSIITVGAHTANWRRPMKGEQAFQLNASLQKMNYRPCFPMSPPSYFLPCGRNFRSIFPFSLIISFLMLFNTSLGSNL